MIRIGPYEIESIVNGSIRLDGGSMFGIVPKVLWDKVAEVDEENRIHLCTRTLLAIDRAERRVILTDTGCGTKWSPDKAARFAVHFDPNSITNVLASHELSAEDVTDVIITHLHFDHNGGISDWFDDPGGRTVLKYPRARHWLHRKHWDHARRPYIKDQASFLREDFSLLEGCDGVRFVDGENPPAPFRNFEWLVSRGHTPFQLHPVFKGDDGAGILFVGDVVPTIAHLRLAWVMAYDVEPLVTIQEKQAIYARCLDEGLSLAFPHDPKVGGVTIDGSPSRPIVSRTLPL